MSCWPWKNAVRISVDGASSCCLSSCDAAAAYARIAGVIAWSSFGRDIDFYEIELRGAVPGTSHQSHSLAHPPSLALSLSLTTQYSCHSRFAPFGAVSAHLFAIRGKNLVTYSSLVTAFGAGVPSGRKPLKQCS